MPSRFTPSRNVTEGDTIAAGISGSLHQVTGSLRITGSLFLNGTEITGSGGGGGGGSPGGAVGDVQFNDGGGGFAGESDLNFDGNLLLAKQLGTSGTFGPMGGVHSGLLRFGNDETPSDMCRIIRTKFTPFGPGPDALQILNNHGPLFLSGSGLSGASSGGGGILLGSAVSASAIKMSGSTDAPDALVIGPTFDFTGFGMGFVHAPGLISSPSSSHGIGMAGFMAWGPDGPAVSQPVATLNWDGLRFQSASTSWMLAGQPPPVGLDSRGLNFSGTAGPGGSGPSFESHPKDGVTIAPTFPPGAFGPGSPQFYAPGLIATVSSSAACGMWIMPGSGDPVMQLEPGALSFSGSNTTSSTDIHPLVSADMFQTSNGAIQIGVIGDPDGPGPTGSIYQSGTMLIRPGTHNKLMIMGPSGPPVVVMNSDGINVSASADGGAISIQNGPLRFSHPNSAVIDFSDTGEGAAALNMPSNKNEGFMIRVQGVGNFLTFKTITGTESVVSNKPLGIGLSEGTPGPKLTLDVHYTGSGSPINLGNDQGGGEVVFFGSGGTTPGDLYYMNAAGTWTATDASTTGSGHNQLLAIAQGLTASSDGMLIRGYHNAISKYEGAFIQGGPVYVGLNSSAMSGAAPQASNEYIRVVGYGTDTASIIYFNPDATYVELA